ncbi:MAG TPA: phosphorylase [Trinickia sp.]|jgi:sulfate adenylyltransferase (ADP) / ATP adenylyltransferase|nr:phosphorylase [Trinickia sp.]
MSPISLFLQPGTLSPSIRRQAAHALERGALVPIETAQTTLDDAGVRFLVRQVSSLADKARARGAKPSSPVDPFLPHDPDLFVADISATHFALLNKFNVIDHHLLIVTRAFEEQNALLTLADFTAWCACLAEFDGLGFYNGGPEAGASQRHKHMQIVPLPLGDAGEALPIDPLIRTARATPDIGTLAGLPFAHAFARLAPAAPEAAAHASLDAYRRLLKAVGIEAVDVNGQAHQSAPYNLLVTPRWMLLVPRSAEQADGVSVNALGFAGSLFVRDAGQMDTVQRLGPMTVLQRVAKPLPVHR